MGKFIFVVGAVYSGCGKGCSVASIGMLLKSRGHSVNLIKLDGYLNTCSGVINPVEHGETFVTNDGKQSDCDLGHYERLCSIETTKDSIFTSGLLYKEVIEEHEKGIYGGKTIQLQHVTDKVKQRIIESGKNHDVTIVECGGVISDSEVYCFLEAIRQLQQQFRQDVLVAVVAPIIWVSTIKEFKTKPLQNGIKELQKAGISPDLLFCRANKTVPNQILDKISNLTNIIRSNIFIAQDVQSIYQIPIEFYNQNVDDLIVDLLRLPRSACRIGKYKELVEKLINNNFPEVNIGIVCKYENVDESYLSFKEALLHAGVANEVKVKIHWIKAEDLEKTKNIDDYFKDIFGIIVPGGFGIRGIEGKIKAAQYARENNLCYIGTCLGLQIAVIEFCRHVCKLDQANSTEFNLETPHPVIDIVKGHENLEKKSESLRLGAYDCELIKDSLAYQLYGKKTISERHRHRYEVNSKYLDVLEKNGLKVVGKNIENNLVEIVELSNHPFFIGTQFHGELKSRLSSPHPLFVGFLKAVKENMAKKENSKEPIKENNSSKEKRMNTGENNNHEFADKNIIAKQK